VSILGAILPSTQNGVEQQHESVNMVLLKRGTKTWQRHKITNVLYAAKKNV
jgi:hypothetical protein